MRLSSLACIALAGLALAACQSKPKPSAEITTPSTRPSGKSAALRNMETVATAAHRCWIASKDAAFRPYRFANELNSMSGQPRFLLVPAKNFGGLPQLVVQASGPSGQVTVFGPLTNGKLGPRINADISRWQSGDTACTGSA